MAAKEYNFEQFADDLEAMMRSKINAKITQINDEFTETIVNPPDPDQIIYKGPRLLSIDDKAFFFQSADERVFNFNPFILYYAGNPAVDDSAYAGIVETYRFTVLICYAKDNSTLEMGKQLARYNRCLKELFIENFKIGQKKVKIIGLEPAGYASINETNEVYTTGVTIEVTFGK